jgi:hypothetical protein
MSISNPRMSKAITVGTAGSYPGLWVNNAINTRLQIMHWDLCSDMNVACTTCSRSISGNSSESLYGRDSLVDVKTIHGGHES